MVIFLVLEVNSNYMKGNNIEEKELNDFIKLKNGFGVNVACLECGKSVEDNDFCVYVVYKNRRRVVCFHLNCVDSFLKNLKKVESYDVPYYAHSYLNGKKSDKEYQVENFCIVCGDRIRFEEKYIEIVYSEQVSRLCYIHKDCVSKLEKILSKENYSKYIAIHSLSE